MKVKNLEVRVCWNGSQWIIREAGCPNAAGISVDGLVMNALQWGPGFAQGFIVACHGLDHDLASNLNNTQLRMLGVGAQIRQFPTPKGMKRLHLGADGVVP